MSLDKNIDIGIVLLPNKECTEFSNSISQTVSQKLPNLTILPNNPHITIIHIANQNPQDQLTFKKEFELFLNNTDLKKFSLPIKDIKATGGTAETGYKWLDLQFETPKYLYDLRTKIIGKFCPLHKGILTRMNDDPSNFVEGSKAKNDIDQCGVTFSNYTPHITTWYIDLPKETKTAAFEEIALSINKDHLLCSAETIALAELGRNGNAVRIIEQYSLNNKISISPMFQGFSAFLILIFTIYLILKFMKKKNLNSPKNI